MRYRLIVATAAIAAIGSLVTGTASVIAMTRPDLSVEVFCSYYSQQDAALHRANDPFSSTKSERAEMYGRVALVAPREIRDEFEILRDYSDHTSEQTIRAYRLLTEFTLDNCYGD